MKINKILWMCFLVLTFATACSEDDPAPEPTGTKPDPEEPKEEVDVTVQDFMWKAMNAYYFWQADVPNLADNRFSTDAEYTAFLAANSDPAAFFYNLCNKHSEIVGREAAVDRFSFLSEDYKELVNSFEGVNKSNGLEFGLSLYGSGSDVLGFVYYVMEGSDAAGKDIKRGDIFYGVNGTALNVDNYYDLLFGGADTYTLNMADVVDMTLIPNGKGISLTKVADFVENPILVSEILDINGQKIAYLMFNFFSGNSPEALNAEFARYQAEGVTDLVLDLRYNPGGFGVTATVLASLIFDTNDANLFYKDRYNAKLQSQLTNGFGEQYFMNTTGTSFGNSNTALNGMHLSKVYVLATDNTASASELVINGLRPYMDVIHIGTTTVGKNQGSYTFVDDPGNDYFYDESRENQINPNDKWAIQPIVILVENAAGFSDYTTGLVPDIELDEDILNMGVLGDVNEPLLARAIQEITGIHAKRSFEVKWPVDLLAGSQMFKPTRDNLIMDGNGNPFSQLKSKN